MDIKIRKILENSKFFDNINSNIYLDPLEDNLIEEERKNEISLGLDDSKKDIVSVKDLKLYIDEVLEKQKNLLRENNIKKSVIFHLWYDYQLDWLRYTFFAKTKKSVEKWSVLEKCYKSTDGWELVNTVDPVLEAFLNQRHDGRFKIDKFGERYFYSYNSSDEEWCDKCDGELQCNNCSDEPPFKIYVEEIIPII